MSVSSETKMSEAFDASGELVAPSSELPRQQRGIDINQALSILSARSDPSENTPNNNKDGCGCCHGSEIPKNAKNLGRTIDLLTNNSGQAEAAIDEQAEEEQRLEERAKRLQRIHEELKLMNIKELLQAVLQVQQNRVATYREYESGLQQVLQTGNVTSYPDTCSKVTASFSVLSETVKAIKEILAEERRRKDLSRVIAQLQSHEKEKLQLTAAYHLERIRHKNMADAKSDPRIEKLLGEGVRGLHVKIGACVEQINETIDELRCALLEEE